MYAFRGTSGLSPLFFFSAWALICSLLLGGGAANIYLTNAMLQIVTLPTIVAALWRLSENGPPGLARPILFLIAAAFLIVGLQLVPLPPAVWSRLPFHDKVASLYGIIGEPQKWAPLSLTPDDTIVGLLTTLPALALFLAVISLNWQERRLLTIIALAFGVINAFIGLVQLSQGTQSALYLYKYSSTSDSVGLFANRNHEAALLYSLTPFAAAWIGALTSTLAGERPQKADQTAMAKLTAAGVTTFILIVATLMTRSRTGVILLMAALFGGAFLQPWRKLGQNRGRASGVFLVIAIAAIALGMQFGLYRIIMRFEADPFAEDRIAIAQITAKVALKALPFGTGLGSFAPLYASAEAPGDLYQNVFVNLAHNEPLQIILETGVFGGAVMLGFCVWLAVRSRSIWRDQSPGDRSPPKSDSPTIDLLLQRAATISIVLLLMHSLVEFPLRSSALFGFFAFCCALLISPSCDKATPEATSEGGIHLGNEPAPAGIGRK